MENVFLYFFAIGTGLSFGLSVGIVPAVIVYRWIKNRKGEGENVYTRKKANARA